MASAMTGGRFAGDRELGRERLGRVERRSCVVGTVGGGQQ